MPLMLGHMERMCSDSSGKSLSMRDVFYFFVSLDNMSTIIKTSDGVLHKNSGPHNYIHIYNIYIHIYVF